MARSTVQLACNRVIVPSILSFIDLVIRFTSSDRTTVNWFGQITLEVGHHHDPFELVFK